METSQPRAQAKLCQRCILPETFPGINFDENGMCNYCRREESTVAKTPARKAEYRQRLDELIKEIKGKAPTYDAITAYSGGKDSSYTLNLLKEHYELRILAVTFDNHFVSAGSWKNIEKVTDRLQIDHISFRPPWSTVQSVFARTAQEDIFPAPTLLRASAICTACIGLVKSLVLKTALEMSIPLVAFGWSPGQAPIQSAIMKTNPAMIRQNQSVLKRAFPSEISQEMDHYFIPDTYYEIYNQRFPHNIHPLAFFDYDEEQIKLQLDDLGWQAPTDTDSNSTNCLLNAFANQCHLQRHGFHPYVWEIANMVRQEVMTRAQGIQKIYSEQDQRMVAYAKERLEL
jgi:tRNA(Ile)-lysidine synthase TilS/MesJ